MTKKIPAAFYVVLWFVLINGAFIAVCTKLSISRPIINIEYLLALLIAMRWKKAAVVFLVAGIFPQEILNVLNLFFPNASWQDYMELFTMIHLANKQILLLMLAALLLLLAFIYSFWRLPVSTTSIALLVIPLAPLFYANSMYQARLWHASPSFDFRNTWIEPYLKDGLFVGINALHMRQHTNLSPEEMERRQRNIESRTATAPPQLLEAISTADKVLLVVNESWGTAHNPLLQEKIMEPITAKKRFEKITTGSFPASNITYWGELRMLCATELVPQQHTLKFTERFENCLPNQLKKAGFATYSFHAARGEMYWRDRRYPKIGFEHRVFLEDRSWPRECHSFPGACDVDMGKEIAKVLGREPKQLVYWLTLNTHLPYDKRDLLDDYPPLDCAPYRAEGEACRLAQLQYQFFQTLAATLAGANASHFQVVVIGDHTPHIYTPSGRDGFMESDISWLSFQVQ